MCFREREGKSGGGFVNGFVANDGSAQWDFGAQMSRGGRPRRRLGQRGVVGVDSAAGPDALAASHA